MAALAFNLLGNSPLLNGVGDALVREIADSGRICLLKGRFGRIEPKEMSTRLFFVLSGEMRMLRLAPDGQEHLIQRFSAGEFFCLAAVVSSHCCKSQMVNAGRTELMYWGHDVFRKLVDQSAVLHHNILAQMAFQIEQEREMRTLSRCCNADVKVAAYLLHKLKQSDCLQKNTYQVELKPISLTAQELGIARETLSRCLQRLVKREGIAYHNGTVKITSMLSLESILDEAECSCNC